MLDPQIVEHFSNLISVIYSFFVVDKFNYICITCVLYQLYFLNYLKDILYILKKRNNI